MDTTTPPSPVAAANPAEDKTVAIIAYLSLIGFIIALIMHSSKKTQLGAFHLRQMLGLILFSIPCMIPLLGLIWFVVMFVFWIFGFIAAINGQMKPVPLFGPMWAKWFANVFT
jgi:hypothetical protein